MQGVLWEPFHQIHSAQKRQTYQWKPRHAVSHKLSNVAKNNGCHFFILCEQERKVGRTTTIIIMMFIAENLCNFMIRNSGNNDNTVSSLAVNFNQALCDQLGFELCHWEGAEKTQSVSGVLRHFWLGYIIVIPVGPRFHTWLDLTVFQADHISLKKKRQPCGYEKVVLP